MFRPRLQRGAQDRSFTPIKVAVHRDCSHEQLLKKCIASVWRGASGEAVYYLSDGSGHKITGEDFVVDGPSGKSEKVPWTLGNYLQACSVKYPSRARLYCVIVHKGLCFFCSTITKHNATYLFSVEECSTESEHSVRDTEG